MQHRVNFCSATNWILGHLDRILLVEGLLNIFVSDSAGCFLTAAHLKKV